MSCAHEMMYNEFRVISPSGWTANTQCVFEVKMTDTTQVYDLHINVRYGGDYPYQNLCLYVQRMSPDSTLSNDTISCNLADKSGKWLGIGSGSVYLLPVPFRPWIAKQQGSYIFKIKHGMSDKYLKGVYAIGLRIGLQDGKE